MKIGIGILFSEDLYNKIRLIELEMAEVTGNHSGFIQPPHITIKRPFELSHSSYAEFSNLLLEKIKQLSFFEIKIKRHGDFNQKTLYLKVDANENLQNIHNDLVKFLRTNFNIQSDDFELENVLFHTTLISNLSSNQYQICQDILNDKSLNFSFNFSEIGVFCYHEQTKTWFILNKFKLN